MYILIIIVLIILITILKNKENFSFDNYKQSIYKTYKLTDINVYICKLGLFFFICFFYYFL